MTRKMRLVVLVGVAGVACVPIRAQAANTATAAEQSVESRVEGEYTAVLGRLLPPDPDPKSRRQKCKWRVVIRISGDADQREEQFAFERMYDGSAHLAVLQAKDRSIWRQLEMLYSVQPKMSVDVAASRVAISRARLDDSREVKAWIKRLEKASIPAAIRVDSYTHGTAYEAWSFGGIESSAGDGNCWRLQLIGPGPGARKQPNEFLGLIEEIRRGLNRRGAV